MIHSTAVNAQQAAFGQIAKGLDADPAAALAKYGLAAMAGAYHEEDQRHLAYELLPHIIGTGNAGAVSLANAAKAATEPYLIHISAAHAHRRALELIASPPTADLDALRATLARDAIKSAYQPEDGRTMSAAILGQCPEGTPAGTLANAVVRSAAPWMRHVSACALVTKACDQIVAGVTSADRAILDLGQAVHAIAYDLKDERTILDGLLKELKACSADTQVQAMVERVQAFVAGMSDESAVGLQQQAFEAVASKRPVLTVPVADPTGRAWPTEWCFPDVKASPTDQRALYEASKTRNEAALRALRALERDLDGALRSLTTQAVDLQARLDALVAPPRPRVALPLVLAGAGAALLAAGAVAGAGAPGFTLAAAGVATAICGWLLRTRGAEARAHDKQKAAVGKELNEVAARSATTKTDLDSVRAAAEVARMALSHCDKGLLVFRMADAPAPSASLSVEPEAVVIGKLRIPRRPAT